MDKWLKDAYWKLENIPKEAQELKEIAKESLPFYARLVNPGYMYGAVHMEIYRWMQEYSLWGQGKSQTSNKLIMLPRAHLKSHMVATWASWVIMRNPEVTILYVSATSDLAEQQLYDIKNILESKQFQKYWPEYIHPDVGKREKWTSTKIIIDHPKRKQESIRDATIAAAGLTTNTTGWHADVIIADDLVIPENAYTEEGRDQVAKKASQFTSIRNAGGFTMACGTRYHPKDVYATWKDSTYPVFDDTGVQIDVLPVWEIKEYVVEEDNIFIWPRVMRDDGKAFGFDMNTLSRIKAEYIDTVQFFAQYYNDPNDPGSDRISRDRFQYYNPRKLEKSGSKWKYDGKRLNIYAAVDFAFSLNRKADYTAIVVVGIDSDSNVYVLDIDRFKTTKVIDYFNAIAQLHSTWKFNKLQAEVTVAQKMIVESIKDYIREYGLSGLSVVEYRPSKHEGSKEERIAAALEHRYDNYKMWHKEGGWTSVLEEELVLARPPHDDIKDALASAVSIAIPPSRSMRDKMEGFISKDIKYSRFGGVPYR